MQNKLFVGRTLKPYVIGGAVALWLTFFFYGLTRNPSAEDANGKLTTMKTDLARLVGNGGVVFYRNENAKLGGALLSVLISADSWTQQLRDKDVKTLVALGWRPTGIDVNSFCKEKMLANIQENAGDYRGKSTVYVSMTYNARTVKTCR